MTTSAAGHYWPSSSSPLPDTTSPVTGRPIRPLPKRRVRDRLSPEQADAIQLPPNPPNSSPIFGYPCSTSEREHAERRPLRAGSGASIEAACECGAEHHREEFSEDDEEHDRQRAIDMTRRDGNFLGTGLATSRQEHWESKHAAPESTSSRDDREYDDPFEERTANKKKRKIPQTNAHHSTLSSDMRNMGITQRGESKEEHEDFAHHTGPGTSYDNNGASTPSPTGSGAASGRSKYGRSGRGTLDRRPLGSSTNGLNAGSKGRVHPGSARMGTSPVEPGIISAAIANAQQTPATPTKGQEHISLLQQYTKSPQSTSDFTFTPEGDDRPVWPVQQMPGAFETSPQPPRQGERPGYRSNGVAHGTQTSPNMSGATHSTQNANQIQGQASAGAQPPPPPLSPESKKKRRNRALQMAARKRKVQQEYKNYHNPPQRGEITICEFCEYEAIFGTPPVALIRQYEIKDRKERKRLAERQRLLEKAKMKGRKGKKGNNKKSNHSNNQATVAHNAQSTAPVNHHQNDPAIDDQLGEEEYYEDDDYEYQDPPIDPPPTPHPDARYPYAVADPGYKGGQPGHGYDDAEFDELPPLIQ